MYTSAKPYFYGTGRRKKSIARVRIVPGTGVITINGRDIDDYFGLETLKLIVNQPYSATGTQGKFDIIATLKGGGFSGTPSLLHLFGAPAGGEQSLRRAHLAGKAVPMECIIVCRIRALDRIGHKDSAALGPAYSGGNFTKRKLVPRVVEGLVSLRTGPESRHSLRAALGTFKAEKRILTYIHKGGEGVAVEIKNGRV